jgi:hypothetical protein
MKQQRPYVLAGLALVAVMLVGAAAQVTREEFDALRKQVEALENKVNEVEQRARRNSGNIVLLKGTVDRMKEDIHTGGEHAGAEGKEDAQAEQKDQQGAGKSYKLGQLLPFSARAPAAIAGATVLGEVWIVDAKPMPGDPTKTLFTGRYPADWAGRHQRVVCVLEVSSEVGLRIREKEKWRIQGTVKNAEIIETSDWDDIRPQDRNAYRDWGGASYALRLYITDVQGTRTGRMESPVIGPTGGFHVR